MIKWLQKLYYIWRKEQYFNMFILIYEEFRITMNVVDKALNEHSFSIHFFTWSHEPSEEQNDWPKLHFVTKKYEQNIFIFVLWVMEIVGVVHKACSYHLLLIVASSFSRTNIFEVIWELMLLLNQPTPINPWFWSYWDCNVYKGIKQSLTSFKLINLFNPFTVCVYNKMSI